MSASICYLLVQKRRHEEDTNGDLAFIRRCSDIPKECFIKSAKNAVETSGISEVITTLQVIKTAVEMCELDSQIEALTMKPKDEKNEPSKRPILGLKK
jgi:hypothetical protein